MDFMPTLIAASQIDYTGHMDGKSFLTELLKGNQPEYKNRKKFYTWLQRYKLHR